MNKKVFDSKKYILLKNSVFSNDDFNKCYKKYLSSLYNEESLKILDKINELKKLELNKDFDKTDEINQLVKYIIENFLNDESKYQINISSEIKSNFFKLELNVNLLYSERFKDIEECIKNDLISDTFNSFVNSKDCIKLIEEYQDDKNLVMLEIDYKFDYKIKNIEIEIITELDIKLLELIKDDYNLELIYSKNNLYTCKFLSNIKFLTDIMPTASMIKTIIYFDKDEKLSIKELAKLVLDIRNDYSYITHIDEEYIDFDKTEEIYNNNRDDKYNFKDLENKRENTIITHYQSWGLENISATWITSIIYNKGKLTAYTKIPLKYKDKELKGNLKHKGKKIKWKSITSFQIVEIELINNKIKLTITIIGNIFKNKVLNDFIFKKAAKKIPKIYLNKVKDYKNKNIKILDSNTFMIKQIENIFKQYNEKTNEI